MFGLRDTKFMVTSTSGIMRFDDQKLSIWLTGNLVCFCFFRYAG